MIEHPQLARHARYRRDERRAQHQLVFPEGMLVLNDTAAAIVRLCDGRSREAVLQALDAAYSDGVSEAEVDQLLEVLHRRGLLRDAADR